MVFTAPRLSALLHRITVHIGLRNHQKVAYAASAMHRHPIRASATLFVVLIYLAACGGGGNDTPPAAPCGPVVDIAPASSTNGALATGDCTMAALFPGLGDQSFADQYRITLPARGKLSISMNSGQFDTLLVLFHSPLQLPEITGDDDSGEDTNALISVHLDAGTYIILANSALATAVTGTYTLTTTFTTVTPLSLTVGSPLPSRVERNEETSYEVAVVPGNRYAVSITGLTDNAALRVFGGVTECADVSPNTSPKECTVTAVGTLLTIRVEGNDVIGTAADYVVMANPAVVVTLPIIGTSGSIPPGVPTVGLVGTRETSRYFSEGLIPGTHTVSITGLTDGANLHVYLDDTYSLELDCTLRTQNNYCTLTTGTVLYFSVSSGPTNRDGAGYIILVW